MMNLILDPMTMSPNLKLLIPDSLYFTLPGHTFKHYWDCGESIESINKKYNININDEIIKIKGIISSGKKFNLCFFSLSILSMEEMHQGHTNKDWINLYKSLYDQFRPYINKLILIDNHGYDYEPSIYITKYNIKYDIMLKRVYSNRNKERYDNKTYSYPFVMCTNNDPFYKMLNTSIFETNILNKHKKIYWAGSVFKHDEEMDNKNTCEHADRNKILNNFNNRYPNIIDVKNVPYNIFHKTISTYKYSLDIRGCSRLNKRLYEILTTNSLVLAEKIDIIWPFENGDKFSEECFFEQGNADDLYHKYLTFENDIELYKKCLENQMYIVKKYFNNEWIWSYINKILITQGTE